jgi:hypothetical protein
MSHTTKIKVEFRDKGALSDAVLRMGGKVLGDGQHRLYGGNQVGFGFTLPGWSYPCVLSADGELAYDNYGGSWGSAALLNTLTGEYALQAAYNAAVGQGWYCERLESSIEIHHPDGGVITVTADGAVDASRFLGPDCVTACAPIEGAIGSQSERTLKNEFYMKKQILLNNGE